MKKIFKINLLEDLRMSLLNFNFVMTYIIHKILVLLKNQLNSIIEFYFFEKLPFFITYNNVKSKV